MLVVNLDGQFTAYVNECAHEALPLDNAVLDATNGTLTCPWHGLRYDAASGECFTAPGSTARAATASSGRRTALDTGVDMTSMTVRTSISNRTPRTDPGTGTSLSGWLSPICGSVHRAPGVAGTPPGQPDTGPGCTHRAACTSITNIS